MDRPAVIFAWPHTGQTADNIKLLEFTSVEAAQAWLDTCQTILNSGER